ncbi:MAG: PhnD/SsuA/transferrin family substrate-binding protein [Chloroflexi bacterium]|nr:PhnD/SsuA/transferrin family substrate-binding protein [Chloroflexota bacterium]
MSGSLILGAVAYDPKVVAIWDGFKAYLTRHGLPFDYVLYSDYERQVEALVAGNIHVAWNSPLAWIRAQRLAASRGMDARAIVMRDSDCDLASVIVVRTDSSIKSVSDLAGRVLGVGAADSPQATMIPLAHLVALGVKPETDFRVARNDLLVGKHGDHIGGEREAAKALLAGKVDAACMIEGNYKLFTDEGTLPANATRVLTRTPNFDHCNFTVTDQSPQTLVNRFRTLLLEMSYTDPDIRPLFDMEGLKVWRAGRTEGYRALENAVDLFNYYSPDGAITFRDFNVAPRVTFSSEESGLNANSPSAFLWKLWLYVNYDCNLHCSYCVAQSSPTAPRRALGIENVKRLVDESVTLGFDHVFFTGGEPFLLNDIYDMLAYSSTRIATTVLTNGMLLRGSRMDKLCAIKNDNLIVQVSLDGGCPEHHDLYRGKGSWEKTVEGIKQMQANSFRVRIGTTETPVNTGHISELCAFHRSLGIPDEDHFVRPLAKRGFSTEGIILNAGNLIPEITVNVDGVFWHPLSTDADMQVSREVFPLTASVARVQTQLDAMANGSAVSLMTFT